MRIHIRPARPDDAEGIVAVFNPIIEAGIYTAFTTPFSAAAHRRSDHRKIAMMRRMGMRQMGQFDKSKRMF